MEQTRRAGRRPDLIDRMSFAGISHRNLLYTEKPASTAAMAIVLVQPVNNLFQMDSQGEAARQGRLAVDGAERQTGAIPRANHRSAPRGAETGRRSRMGHLRVSLIINTLDR